MNDPTKPPDVALFDFCEQYALINGAPTVRTVAIEIEALTIFGRETVEDFYVDGHFRNHFKTYWKNNE